LLAARDLIFLSNPGQKNYRQTQHLVPTQWLSVRFPLYNFRERAAPLCEATLPDRLPQRYILCVPLLVRQVSPMHLRGCKYSCEVGAGPHAWHGMREAANQLYKRKARDISCTMVKRRQGTVGPLSRHFGFESWHPPLVIPLTFCGRPRVLRHCISAL
jgi:hypothetical protein